ncbi:MAG TPA: PIN domain-containing protein [Afipia sp.]
MGLRINYVLIDYESVQPEALSVLHEDHFRLIVFVGATQAKVSFETAVALQRMGNRAEYIKIAGSGPNALDFHIAFYIGQLAQQEGGPYFHIISKDTGFDPLIQHLKRKKILAARWCSVTEIPLLKVSNAKLPTQKLALIVEHLKTRGAARPRKVKTLVNTIGALFQKKVPEEELLALVGELQAQGLVAVSDTNVSYSLPG